MGTAEILADDCVCERDAMGPRQQRDPANLRAAIWASWADPVWDDRVMSRTNVFSSECELDETDPDGYHSGVAPVGESAGGEALVVKVFELPPGQAVCPYHYEYEEEWLVVLVGAVTVRVPDRERELGTGEVMCFAPGPAGAHKVSNNGTATARVLMFSSAREPAVSVYPDSDKIGVWPGNGQDNAMLHRADGHVEYWDGEG
jgi:uncharacterized cupin superfamily protein